MNGIGGKTIAEAKENLSYKEYLSWIRYRNKHGSIDGGRRVDRSLSIIAAHFSRAFVKFEDGSKAKPDDFTLYPFGEEEKEGNAEDVFRLLSSMAKPE